MIVAIKKIDINAKSSQERELRIAETLETSEFNYVIPIIDHGQDENTNDFFIVMPLAEKSLDEELKLKGSFSYHDGSEILFSISKGLKEIPNITHRDLKPKNILFHDNKWKR